VTYPARTERIALADLLEVLGPDAPTLCAGWRTRDLAAHLVLRDRRPDATPGLLVPQLAGHTATVQRQLATRPWPDLTQLVRTGPPRWLPSRFPPVDAVLNTTEYFIHHEDVRRAQDSWEPRMLDPTLEDKLWADLRGRAKALYRKAGMSVLLRRESGEEISTSPAEPSIVVVGRSGELALHASGRGGHALVRVEGEPADLHRLADAPRGI
jgi:uncharacterized protein (TIGR03085 family)